MNYNDELVKATEQDDNNAVSYAIQHGATNLVECLTLAIAKNKNTAFRRLFTEDVFTRFELDMVALFYEAVQSDNMFAIQSMMFVYPIPLDVSRYCMQLNYAAIHAFRRYNLQVCVPNEFLYTSIETSNFKVVALIINCELIAENIFIEVILTSIKTATTAALAAELTAALAAESKYNTKNIGAIHYNNIAKRYYTFIYLLLQQNMVSHDIMDHFNHRTLSNIMDILRYIKEQSNKVKNNNVLIDNYIYQLPLYKHINVLHAARQQQIKTVIDAYDNNLCDHKNIAGIINEYISYSDTIYDTPQSIITAYSIANNSSVKL